MRRIVARVRRLARRTRSCIVLATGTCNASGDCIVRWSSRVWPWARSMMTNVFICLARLVPMVGTLAPLRTLLILQRPLLERTSTSTLKVGVWVLTSSERVQAIADSRVAIQVHFSRDVVLPAYLTVCHWRRRRHRPGRRDVTPTSRTLELPLQPVAKAVKVKDVPARHELLGRPDAGSGDHFLSANNADTVGCLQIRFGRIRKPLVKVGGNLPETPKVRQALVHVLDGNVQLPHQVERNAIVCENDGEEHDADEQQRDVDDQLEVQLVKRLVVPLPLDNVRINGRQAVLDEHLHHLHSKQSILKAEEHLH
mmetsp:Transcript_7432/g.19052  ORF Transcript_7432/g.19052 Transcript_7432/m.19052 type:complete len:311 (+) Transcript_7432:502-1434(+)